jgi:hypothetical protein
VKELMEDLQKMRGGVSRGNTQVSFLVALRDCCRLLDTSGEAVRPLNLIVVIPFFRVIVFEAVFS